MKIIETVEKWAIQHLLERKVKGIKLPDEWLSKIWRKYSDEIYKAVISAIEKAIDKVIEKALRDMKIDIGKNNG